MNIDILGISERKWTRMGEFNSDDHYIYYCGPESLGRNGAASPHSQQKSPKCSTWKEKVKSLSHARLFVTPWTVACTKLLRPWDFQGKSTGVGCHFLLQCMKVKSESEVAQLCPPSVTPWTAAFQAPPSTGFSRQEYWNGVPLAPLGVT